MTWHVSLLTLFPEMFPGMLEFSLAGKALEAGIWSYKAHSLRDFGLGRHKNIDDTPFGGGAGMVMRVDVLDQAIEAMGLSEQVPLIYFTPRGKPLTQDDVIHYARLPKVGLICGRYEGVDERIFGRYPIKMVSIGDYILSGGEVASMVFMDACIRLLPGVMGASDSADEESFADGLLEYPHYTRPYEWKGETVPDILLSGHHQKIRQWRQSEAENLTRLNRPDLWQAYISSKNSKN